MHNLANHTYPILLSTGVVASSTDFYTECVDMRGYEGVLFQMVTATTGNAAITMYAQMSATSSGTGTFVDVYGSTVTHSTGFNATQALSIIDVYRPNKRWVRVYVDRATTDEAISAITALLYRPQISPPSFSTARGVSDVNIVIGTSS